MNRLLSKFIIFFFVIGMSLPSAQSQGTFWQIQKNSIRVSNAFSSKEYKLEKEFADKGLQWPAKYVYIRSFKYDMQLEVWVKNDAKEKYQLFKTYKVCMQSGTLGPKRFQGDYQIPEGFYYINEFNPRSNYHLSLGINYPNESDKVLSDLVKPGGNIYIHGSCVSVGCIAVDDDDIEEVYLLAGYARDAGQEYIPVHIFPIRFGSEKSVEYLNKVVKGNSSLQKFTAQLKEAYDSFEETRQLPIILIDSRGDYVVN